MSTEELDIDPEAKREELIERAKEHRQDLNEEQDAALQQIGSGEEFGDYTDVRLGELDLTVKAWVPGRVEKTVRRAQSIADDSDPEQIRASMETMFSALAEMTQRDDFNEEFWGAYYDEYGPEGIIVAAETILGPAVESMEDKRDAIDGFRADGPRSKPGTGGGTDRQRPG